MKNKYFETQDSLYDITEKYKVAIDLLVSVGFENIKDENSRKTFGKAISLGNALKLKNINVETFVNNLVEKIEEEERRLKKENRETIKIAGVLPCPVKVPLNEAFEKFIEEKNLPFNLEYDLKAASMGIDWIMEDLKNDSIENIPDMFISAGFDLFFDKNLFGKYKTENLFEDITGIENYNTDFNNDYISLKDSNGQYSILSVVPAIFLVNKDELKGRKMPESWEDILSDEFINSVTLPIKDLDLFNAILLNLYKNFGEDGIKRLGRSLKKSMHPSEMVKSHIKIGDKPVVTIMPYFFTWMVKPGSPMVAVWPKDGAIISPVFMLTKKEKQEELKPIADFFAGKEVGEILAHQGKFPSVNPEVDNMLPKENKYMWLGWDFIKENDISSLLKKCEDIFHKSVKGEE